MDDARFAKLEQVRSTGNWNARRRHGQPAWSAL